MKTAPRKSAKNVVSFKKAAVKKAPVTKVALLAARDRLHELSEIQAKAREEELQIREWVANKLHEGEEGSKTLTIHDIKLTVSRTLNRTIGFDEAHRFAEEHPEIAVEVLRYKPEIKVGAYKAHADIADDYIVTKPGPPSVKFA